MFSRGGIMVGKPTNGDEYDYYPLRRPRRIAPKPKDKDRDEFFKKEDFKIT